LKHQNDKLVLVMVFL